MKRAVSLILSLILLLSCAPALAEGADIKADFMPADVREFFSSSSFNGFTIGETASYLLENTVGGSFFFAVAQKEGHNVLYGFAENNGRYQYWLRTDNAIAQGKGFFVLNYHSGDLHLLSGQTVNIGEGLSIIFTREDYEEQHDNLLYFAVNKNGQFNLKAAFVDYGWEEVLVSSDSLTYSHEGEKEGAAYGVVETNLRYFSYAAFPKTLREARAKLSNPPAIPAGELSAQRVKFSGGQKFEVYSGPGMEYERAANGKAAVSTNDWIQVFGSENGYILIQYDISSTQNRMGYITQTALPRNASVSPLNFSFADASITAATFLTDDPLKSQSSLRALQSGQQVKWLAVMGDWVYVEVTGAGQSVRGFVPASAVSRASLRRTFSTSFQCQDYTASATAEIVYGASSTVTVTVSGPAAWRQENGDRITGYQLFANNVPVATQSSEQQLAVSSGWSAVFTLTATLPSGASLLSLCPVHARSGQNAGEMIIMSLDGASRTIQNGTAAAGAAQESAWAYNGYNVAVVNNPNPQDRLHLRERAYGGSTSKSLGKYYNGTVALLLPDNRDGAEWAHVRVGETEGYMEAKYLAFGDAARQVASAQPQVTVDNQGGTGLNLRAGQSTDSAVITLLPNGAQVTVWGLSEDWLHVEANGQTGYIKATGVSPRVPYTYGAPEGNAHALVTSRVTKAALYSAFTDEMWDGAAARPADAYANAGARLTVMSTRGDFSLVRYNGSTYWISSYDLDPV